MFVFAGKNRKFTTMDRASMKGVQRHVMAVYVASLCVMLLLFGGIAKYQYDQEIQDAHSRSQARASIASAWVEGLLRESRQALRSAAEMQALAGATPQVMQRSLANIVQEVPLLAHLKMTDASGRVRFSSTPGDIARATTVSEDRLVSGLHWSDEDQRYYLYHRKPVPAEPGAQGGVAVASLLPDAFAIALGRLRAYPGENIVLLDADLRALASHPRSKEVLAVGEPIGFVDQPARLEAGAFLSPWDKNDYWLLQPEAESVSVAISISPYYLLAEWRQRVGWLLAVWAAMALLGAWGVRHYLNRLTLAYRLQSREARLNALIHSLQDLVFVFDERGRFSYIHAIETDKLLINPHQAIGRHYRDILPAGLAHSFDTVFSRVKHTRQAEVFEYPLDLGPTQRYFQATVSPLAGDTEPFKGVLSVTRDITDAKQAEVELRIAAAAFQAHLGIMVTDARGNILKVNDTFKRITGYSDEEVVGKNPRMFSSGHHSALFYRRLWKSVMSSGSWEGEIWNQRKSGELFPEWLTISAVYGPAGDLTHYVATMSDISERKAAEQEIHQLAFYDPLTGFANRRLFMDRVCAALKDLNRHQRCGALLLLDIDNFNHVNDTLGYQAGDHLLQGVARRFGQMLRDTDTLARLGGDEFAVLVEGVDGSPRKTQALAEHIASKLMAALDTPIQVGDEQASVTASVGITVMADSQRSADDYLQQADMALSQAKASGRRGLRFFDPSMQAALLARVKLESDLRLALDHQQWLLHYQPQVDEQGRIVGVEALLRWHHPERGLVSPGEFIPLLESTGLINDVGEWVLEAACHQLAAWQHLPGFEQLTISVNISPLQFRESDFLHRVEQVFQRTRAPLERLKLEVTETLFVDARDDARDKMLSLKARGVRFSLDDFGTGYSSLAYLAQLPLDQLKIDQSFVQQVLESSANAAIVESTIASAKSLNLDVIAEGSKPRRIRHGSWPMGAMRFRGICSGGPCRWRKWSRPCARNVPYRQAPGRVADQEA